MLLIPGLLVFHIPTISKNKGYENLAARVDPKNETFNQSYYKDFDSSEAPLEEGMATHSSILAWRIPMDRGAWWATVHSVAKSQTRLK